MPFYPGSLVSEHFYRGRPLVTKTFISVSKPLPILRKDSQRSPEVELLIVHRSSHCLSYPFPTGLETQLRLKRPSRNIATMNFVNGNYKRYLCSNLFSLRTSISISRLNRLLENNIIISCLTFVTSPKTQMEIRKLNRYWTSRGRIWDLLAASGFFHYL